VSRDSLIFDAKKLDLSKYKRAPVIKPAKSEDELKIEALYEEMGMALFNNDFAKMDKIKDEIRRIKKRR
jgi:protein-arginine kinase activator protein McsA